MTSAVPLPLMDHEAAEAGAACARQHARTAAAYADLGARLRDLKPTVVITCARGSSDHACAYGKYLIETRLGVPVASIGPSVVSLYEAPLQVAGALFIAVSQSGRSPDLLRLAEAARRGGALVVALVNDEDSPLARLADIFLPLCAGPEKSVAATKSYLTACYGFLQLVAHWQQDPRLLGLLDQVPGWLDAAAALDWYPQLRSLEAATGLYVLGRGVGSGAAAEIALKCKETSRLHAEAFSAAEVVHGPFALVGPGFPILALTQNDVTREVTRATLVKAAGLDAPVLATEADLAGVTALPVVADLPPEVAPLAAVASFYRAIHKVARARGLDPDVPPNLRKVTETM